MIANTDVTHVRVSAAHYYSDFYLDAVTADDFSCCGNGDIESPYEQCDDDDTDSGDGCSSVCEIEP